MKQHSHSIASYLSIQTLNADVARFQVGLQFSRAWSSLIKFAVWNAYLTGRLCRAPPVDVR